MSDLDASVIAAEPSIEPSIGKPDTRRSFSGLTRRGLLVTSSSRLLVQLMQLASTVVLARILGPEAYGLVALITVFTGFAAIFTDLGLGAAIVQKAELTEIDLATAFWLNAVSGLVLTGSFVGLAWPIADLYSRPQLVALTIVASLGFSLSMSIVPISILQRDFNFLRIAQIEIGAAAVSLCVAVVMASLNAGALSLAVSTVISVTITTLLSWLSVAWRPRTRPTLESAAQLWSFTRYLLAFNVMNYWGRNLDNLTIGKISGSAALAFYSRAYNVMLIPINQIQRVSSRVLYPVMASLKSQPERMSRAYLRVITVTVAAAAPVCVGLSATSPALVHVLYGSDWKSAGPILAVLALAGPPQILGSSVSVVLQALGMTDVQFRRGIISFATSAVAIALGAHWGAMGVAVALCVRAYVVFPLNYLPTARRLSIDARQVFQSIGPSISVTALMGACVWGLGAALDSHGAPVVLALQVATGALLYLGGLRFADPTTFREVSRRARAKKHS